VVSTDVGKTKAVKNWLVPKNVIEVCGFIGLCSYYKRVVLKYASVAKPFASVDRKRWEVSMDGRLPNSV
jgi:hypothetical protein